MRTAWKTTQELQHQERGELPGLDPNPIAWGEGKGADTLSPQTKRCARSLKPKAVVESSQLLS
jgi:hypothetical protein